MACLPLPVSLRAARQTGAAYTTGVNCMSPNDSRAEELTALAELAGRAAYWLVQTHRLPPNGQLSRVRAYSTASMKAGEALVELRSNPLLNSVTNSPAVYPPSVAMLRDAFETVWGECGFTPGWLFGPEGWSRRGEGGAPLASEESIRTLAEMAALVQVDANSRRKIEESKNSDDEILLAGVSSEGGRQQQNPDFEGMDDEEIAILCALASHRPRYIDQAEIEAASDLSRKTISGRLNRLKERGLVLQKDQRGGYLISAQGMALLKTLTLPDGVRKILCGTASGQRLFQEISKSQE
jgi:uncharacterized membrane protein